MLRVAARIAAPLLAALPGGWLMVSGRRRRGAAYAIPLLVAIALAAAIAAAGRETWLRLLDPAVATAAAGAALALGAIHVVSVVDAIRLVARRSQLPAAAAVIVIVGVVHGAMAGVGFQLSDTLNAVFSPAPELSAANGPSVGPGDPEPEVREADTTPPPRRELEVGERMTVLLVGVDSLGERDCCGLTDTLLVASLDPETNTLTMVSLPRDIAGFELYSGGTFTGKINSLLTFAAANPGMLPDPPLEALRRQVSFLLGDLPIDHYGAVDLDGLLAVVDVLGGVEVTLDAPIDDRRYEGGPFYLPAGSHRLSGDELLGFVRSRGGDGATDFTRAARQQQVVAALVEQATDPATVTRLPSLLRIVRDTVRTDLPLAELPSLLELVSGRDRPETVSLTLDAPYTVHPPMSETGGAWVLRLDAERTAQLIASRFAPEQ